jgi:hypothetical protein
MPEEISKFYDDNYGGIDGFIVSGKRRGLNPEAIRCAARIVYEKRASYKDMRVMWQHLLLQAHKVQKQGVRTEQKRIDDLERRIEILERKRTRSFKKWFINLFEGQIWL